MSRSSGNWKFNIRNARTVAFAASHKYQTQTQREGNVTLTSYYLAEHVAAGQEALKAGAQSLKIFNDRFGAYPYTTLIIAENAYLGSATASGIILHTGRGYADYVGRPDSFLTALTPQAMSRLWWGQAVMGDSVFAAVAQRKYSDVFGIVVLSNALSESRIVVLGLARELLAAKR